MNTPSNALTNTGYQDFVALMQTPRGGAVRLDTGAALSLCRNGHVKTKAPLAWLGLFWVSLLAAVPTVLFWNWQYAPVWIFLMWLAARRSKFAAVSAVWRELKGTGILPEDQRAAIYETLVAQNLLRLPPEAAP